MKKKWVKKEKLNGNNNVKEIPTRKKREGKKLGKGREKNEIRKKMK